MLKSTQLGPINTKVNSANLILAKQWIKSGKVVAYPTESVYGLGCDPKNINAINKLLKLKQRNKDKGLILVASHIDQILPYVDKQFIKKIKDQIFNKSYDRAITWLIPASNNVSSLLSGTQMTGTSLTGAPKVKRIAIRFSQHPFIKSLCDLLEFPIISTSANISGQKMCYSVSEIKQQFNDKVKYIIDEPLGTAERPSQIKDLITNKVLRD